MKDFFTRRNASLIAFFGFWTAYFLAFWPRALRVNEAGGITAGHVNIWGDWAIHLTMGSAMAYRELFLAQNPILIDSVFKYPFFVNQFSAILIRAGVPFFSAFTVPSFFFSIFFVAAVYAAYRILLGARRVALSASFIFLLSGGLGFLKFIYDVATSSEPLKTLLVPPIKYTRFDDWSVHWINVVDSMVIPQRAFQLGFPIALVIIAIVYRWRGNRMPMAAADAPPPADPPRWKTIGLAALLGFTPLVHAHAFAGTVAVLGCWALYDVFCRPGKRGEAARWWLLFALWTAAVTTPVYLAFFSGAQNLSAIRWAPGWYALDEGMDLSAFWLINWGLMGPMAIFGGYVACRKEGGRFPWGAFMFAWPFIAMFIGANLFLFHPWIWDNTKILVWSSFGFSAFAAMAVEYIRSHDGAYRRLAGPLAVFLMFVMTASGAVDLYRAQVPGVDNAEMYRNEELFLADWTRKNTAVKSVWLTGDYHNHWLFNLTGRQAVMTYVGWLWTHGYEYQGIEHDVREMYANPTRVDLFRKYGVDYVVIGPYERDTFGAYERGFAARYETAIRTDSYAVYNVNRKRAEASKAPAPPDTLDATMPLSADLRDGLVRRTYRGKYFFGESLVKEGDLDVNFHFDAGDPKPFNIPVSIEWEGFLKVAFEGTYRFSLASDDGAYLFLDERMLIDNGGVHMLEESTHDVWLSEGYHRIRLRYYDVGGGAILRFGWASSPGRPASFDASALYH